MRTVGQMWRTVPVASDCMRGLPLHFLLCNSLTLMHLISDNQNDTRSDSLWWNVVTLSLFSEEKIAYNHSRPHTRKTNQSGKKKTFMPLWICTKNPVMVSSSNGNSVEIFRFSNIAHVCDVRLKRGRNHQMRGKIYPVLSHQRPFKPQSKRQMFCYRLKPKVRDIIRVMFSDCM